MAADSLDEKPETTLERIKSVSAYIEELIFTTGEHPECELKTTWMRTSPYLKAEFIRDIQSTANSFIPKDKEKYIVVGADAKTREIIGCDPLEFDEAPIRQLLESHLDSVPTFEIMSPKSSKNGKDFVVLRFPYQTRQPYVVKKSIVDEKQKFHLKEGEIWIKPTDSTGKRLIASRDDLLRMIEIESLVNAEVERRLADLIPQIREEERSRVAGGGFGAVPAQTSTDDEFEIYVEQLIGSSDGSRFYILLEKLRDNCFAIWEKMIESDQMVDPDELLEIKTSVFLPAIRRLTLLGILIIKYNGNTNWFDSIANLLAEIFNLSTQNFL